MDFRQITMMQKIKSGMDRFRAIQNSRCFYAPYHRTH